MKAEIYSKENEFNWQIKQKSLQMLSELDKINEKCQESFDNVKNMLVKVEIEVAKNKENLDKWLIDFNNSQMTSQVDFELVSEQCEFEKRKLTTIYENVKENMIILENYKAQTEFSNFLCENHQNERCLHCFYFYNFLF